MNDTIVAVATALGSGGMGVIRVSGSEAFEKVNSFFSGDLMTQEPRTLVYGNFFNCDTQIIDDVVISKFKAPNSYTGEDVLEISAHGNIVILDEIIETLINSGLRIADPGEFTKRAFLNGKLDLSQAEAVNDLIKSKTHKSKNLALSQLKGSLGNKIKEINNDLMRIRAEIEASIDFPEDVEEPDRNELCILIKNACKYIQNLIDNNKKSYYFRDGFRISIVGNVNVGKSSILNALIDSERAIVTNIPGTTRDILTESLDINGIPVIISDTAGVRETDDAVEKIGVEKSLTNLAEADLILMVYDGSRKINDQDKDITEKTFGKRVLYVINKSDISETEYLSSYNDYLNSNSLLTFDKIGKTDNLIIMSVKSYEYIETLKNKIYECAGCNDTTESLMITNNRHIEALKKALLSLEFCLKSLENNMELDCVAIDLSECMYQMGLITGETTTEDILDYIFSEFCIGK